MPFIKGKSGFGIWAFIWGVIVTIIVYEFILNKKLSFINSNLTPPFEF